MAASSLDLASASNPRCVRPRWRPALGTRVPVTALKLLATVQVVWFYLARTQSQMDLRRFELGLERTPFQYRLLLMLPLRWAHQASLLQAAGQWLTLQRAWFPHGVRPEGILEAAINMLSVFATAWAVERMYRRSSRTQALAPFVFGLVLLLVHSTYSLMTYHAHRFPADMPAMAFFALGSYLIYTEKHPAWFVLIFVLSTCNRETSLMLLLLIPLARGAGRGQSFWAQASKASTFLLIAVMAAFWLGWRLWVAHRFAANASAAGPRLLLNLATLCIPLAWPQLLAAGGFLLPAMLAVRRRLRDPVLRSWLWMLPAWFGCMLYFGLFIEIRIFGELIPYVALCSLLLAEEFILQRVLGSAEARNGSTETCACVRTDQRRARAAAEPELLRASARASSRQAACYDQRAPS